MEQLRVKYNTAKTDDERKDVAKQIATRLYEYQNNIHQLDISRDYLEYCLEYITPDLPKQKSIAIYCGNGWEKWDPHSIKKGIPGSEEAVIYVSQVLAKRGYNVTVFNKPPESSLYNISNSNPRYVPFTEYQTSNNVDILIIWRCQNFPDWMLAKGSKIYYWLHDMGMANAPFQVAKECAGVFYLSKYHRDTYPHINTNHCIAGNGLVPEQFSVQVKRDPYKCIYASNYSRGLSILLAIWPFVKQSVPKATLDIYYGREVYNSMDGDNFRKLISTLDSMKELGVCEKGKVGHVELATAMCGAGFWTYPCITAAETFCITAVKAQAAGMIPVCTTVGALDEVLLKNSCITIKEITCNDHVNEYKDKLIAALSTVSDKIDPYFTMRSKLRLHGLSYTWDKVVDIWFQLMEL